MLWVQRDIAVILWRFQQRNLSLLVRCWAEKKTSENKKAEGSGMAEGKKKVCHGFRPGSAAFFVLRKRSSWAILGKLCERFDRALLALNTSLLINSTLPGAIWAILMIYCSSSSGASHAESLSQQIPHDLWSTETLSSLRGGKKKGKRIKTTTACSPANFPLKKICGPNRAPALLFAMAEAQREEGLGV